MESSYSEARILMPAINPSNHRNATPRRVPKLAVRNRYAESESSLQSSSGDSRSPERGARHADSSLTLIQEQDDIQEASRKSSEPDLNLVRSSAYSAHKHASLQTPPRQETKKRRSGVFGFLVLKEPSTSAWHEFAEQEKQKAAARGTVRPNAVGLPGVSSQKLPEHVPKVNSKWDGLPETANNKMEAPKSKEGARSKRNSAFSTSTGHSHLSAASFGCEGSGSFTPAKSRMTGKVSRPQSFASASTYRTSVQRSSSSAYKPSSQRMQSSPRRLGSAQTFLHPPSPPPPLPDAAYSLAKQESVLLGVQTLELNDAVYTVTSSEPSASTPGGTYSAGKTMRNARGTTGSIDNNTSMFSASSTEAASSPALHDAEIALSASPASKAFNWAFPAGEASELRLSGDSDRSQPKSILKDRLRPAPLHALVKAPPHPHRTYSNSSNATIRTVTTVRSPTFSTRTQVEHSTPPTTVASTNSAPSLSLERSHSRGKEDLKDGFPAPMRSDSIASTVPSVAPSIMSAQWSMTPKERLGLGSRVKKADVLPWEMDPLPDEDDTPKQESSKQRKRFSLLSRK